MIHGYECFGGAFCPVFIGCHKKDTIYPDLNLCTYKSESIAPNSKTLNLNTLHFPFFVSVLYLLETI